jgi:hypothetical protein
MTEVNRRPSLPSASLRKNEIVKAGPGTEKYLFDVGAASVLHPAPFLDRDKDCSFDSPAGDYLGTFLQRCVKKLAEPRFGVL